jgi:hypothetical protein
LVCLDGFDSIIGHTEESRSAIFAGLIDAVRKSSRDSSVSSSFCFKAFLPQELTGPAHKVTWDEDKYVFHTHYVRWSKENFQDFLKKRLYPYAKSKGSQFPEIWHQFMPDRVGNSPHRVEERSFEYILRHTLYRPRQLLTHVQRILDRWDESNSAFRVDPTFIPRVVAETNYELADSVVTQLEVSYPTLSVFLRSWSGVPNVMPLSDFKLKVKRFFECETVSDENVVFDALFSFGIFGVELTRRVSQGARSAPFRFAFAGDRPIRNMHATIDGGELLALAPMFNEYCGCSPSDFGPIMPVPINAGNMLRFK